MNIDELTLQDFDSVMIVNLANLKSNYLSLKANLDKALIGASIKANAYGLGAAHVARALNELGCQNFFVSNLDEAVELRQIFSDPEIKIYNFKGITSDNEISHKTHHITATVNCFSQLNSIQDKTLPIIVNIDTGLSRLGIDLSEFLQKIREQPDFLDKFNVQYLMSHLSCSDEPDSESNKTQLAGINEVRKLLPNLKISFANSTGSLLGKKYQFDLIRPGQMIYGIEPFAEKNLVLPVVKLLSPIIQIRKLTEDSYVGYNQRYHAKKGTILAICPIGYADGLRRGIVHQAAINGEKTRTCGSISMDLTIVDISHLDLSKIKIGTMVEFIGEHTNLHDFSENCNTIGYEILCNMGKRIKRIYV